MSQLDFDGGETPMPDPEPAKRQHEWVELKYGFKCKACGVNTMLTDREHKPCPGELNIYVRIDGDYNLQVGDVWPDGDYPDEITADAVLEVMQKETRGNLTVDWGLTPDYHVSVAFGRELRVFD